MGWAVSKLQESHLEQIGLCDLQPITVPVLGEIFVRPVVNAAKTIEIETLRLNGDLGGYMLTMIRLHCVDGEERALIQKADKTSLLNGCNFETLSSIFNAVKEVVDSKGVDVKKL